jgi:hypothetical protein
VHRKVLEEQKRAADSQSGGSFKEGSSRTIYLEPKASNSDLDYPMSNIDAGCENSSQFKSQPVAAKYKNTSLCTCSLVTCYTHRLILQYHQSLQYLAVPQKLILLKILFINLTTSPNKKRFQLKNESGRRSWRLHPQALIQCHCSRIICEHMSLMQLVTEWDNLQGWGRGGGSSQISSSKIQWENLPPKARAASSH